MKWFRRVPKGFDLDSELEQAERDVWRTMFETAQKTKPDDEFARRLESRLRSRAQATQAARPAQIRPLSRPTRQANTRTALPLRSTQAPSRGWFQVGGRLMGFATVAVRLSVLVVVVLGMAVLWRGGLRPNTSTTEMSIGPVGPTRPYEEVMRDFLPPGKVRHLVIELTYTPIPGDNPNSRPQTQVGRQEVWIAAGAEHPRMRTYTDMPARVYSFIQPFPDAEGFWMVPIVSLSALVDDGFIYENLDGSQIIRHPYNSRYMVPFLPSDGGLPGWIYEAWSRVTGYTTLRGRAVTLLEDISPVPPVVKPAPSLNGPNHYVANTYVALDTNTRQLIQAKRVTTFITGRLAGQQATHTYDLLVDELENVEDLTPDFFNLTPYQEEHVISYSSEPLFYSELEPRTNSTPLPITDMMLPAVTDVLTNTSLDQKRP